MDGKGFKINAYNDDDHMVGTWYCDRYSVEDGLLKVWDGDCLEIIVLQQPFVSHVEIDPKE